METKSLVLWLNSDCNLRCKYCYARGGESPEYMDFETAKKAVDAMGEGEIKLQFSGGEPLLSEKLLFQICKYVKGRKNVTLSLQTNGTLIDEKIAAGIKRYGIGTGVSLDGPREINESQRGKTAEALRGIRHLADAGVYVNINSVLTDQSVEHLTELYDLCLLLGNVPSLAFDFLRITGRARENMLYRPPSREQMERNFKKLRNHISKMKKLFGKSIKIRDLEKAKLRLSGVGDCDNYCYASLGQSFVVVPDGEIYACGSLVGNPRYAVGNVDHPEEWERVKLKSAKDREICGSCEYDRVCPGICPAAGLISPFTKEDCYLKYNAFQMAENNRQ